MVPNVQRLLSTVNTEATAKVVSQTYRNRRSADKAVVCMGGTYGVMVDLDRCEGYAMQLLVGTHLINNHHDRLFASCGFRVYKGARPYPVTACLADFTVWASSSVRRMLSIPYEGNLIGSGLHLPTTVHSEFCFSADSGRWTCAVTGGDYDQASLAGAL